MFWSPPRGQPPTRGIEDSKRSGSRSKAQQPEEPYQATDTHPVAERRIDWALPLFRAFVRIARPRHWAVGREENPDGALHIVSDLLRSRIIPRPEQQTAQQARLAEIEESRNCIAASSVSSMTRRPASTCLSR